MNGRTLKIIDGSANTELVDAIVDNMDSIDSKADVVVTSFSDGETRIEISENMRGCDVFVVQPICHPANDHLMQLYLILDALKRSNCWRVTAVIPYYGYGRQDKKLKPRVPISARAVADLIQLGQPNRILTMDLHSNQIQGYFNCPVDNLFASSIFLAHIRSTMMNQSDDIPFVIVSPDEGGIARAVHYSKTLNIEAAMLHKSRIVANAIDEMILLGFVRDMKTIIIDDMIDTAGTFCRAADVLKRAGAVSVVGYVTHGVFSGQAYEKIEKSKLDKIYVTDSIPQYTNIKSIEVISCANLLAQAILNIHHETSVSCLFDH